MKNFISKVINSKAVKNILKLGFVITGCLVLASFSPSLDGRAVVVEPGVFPEGLFAKTVGYLPGDIISVTNITGETTVDILVIGALDPSEGVAIMLSPEAAEAIGINRNSNNIVKITKRSNQDERVYGSAVIAAQNKEAEEVVNETAPVVSENTPVVSEPAPVETENEPVAAEIESDITEPESFIEENEETFEDDNVQEFYTDDYVDEPAEEFTEPQTVPYVEEEIYSKPIEEEPFEDEPVIEYDYVDDELLPQIDEESVDESEYIAGTDEEYVEEEVEEEEPQEEITEPEEEIPEEEPVEEEFYEDYEDEGLDDLEDLDEEDFEEEDIVEAEEEFEEEEQEEEPVEEAVEEEEGEEEPVEEPVEEEFFDDDELPEQPADEQEYEDEELENIEEEPVKEEPKEDELFEEETEDFEEEDFEEEPEDEYEDEVLEEPEDFDDEVIVLDEEEEYDAIVLVPADENPPEEPLNLGPYGNVTNSVVTEIEEEQFEEVEVEASPVVVQPAATGNETSYSKFMIESLNELEAEKYYIQIATLRDDENILEIVNKYGQKYPITIVPAANGAKQVLIGPVTLDEYGTVLARFKAYGYKDAFLRKGTNPNPKAKGSAATSADAK